MREVKFRVWFKRKIHYVNQIWFKGNGGAYKYRLSVDEVPFSDEVILMQYTGFKDKNGKEIYEGDILKNNIHGIIEVSYEDGRYGCFWIYSDPIELSEIGVVIGNIYENPDLI